MVLCGLLSAAAYPPLDLWPLALVLLIPVIALAWRLTPRRALVAGYIYGMSLTLGGMYWVSVVMATYGRVDWPIVGVTLVLMALYGGMFFASFSWLIAWWRGPRVLLLVLMPFFWVGHEYLRAHLLFGFPWCPWGQALAAYPPMAQTAEWFSAPGLSALVVLVNGLLAWALVPGGPRRTRAGRWSAAVLAVAVLAAAWGWGTWRMEVVGRAMARAPKLTVSVVQANIPLNVLHDRKEIPGVMAKITALTQQEAAKVKGRPWLVVWPETAAPFYFMYDRTRSNPVLQLARRLGIYLTLGSSGLERSGNKIFPTNRAWLVWPDGQRTAYYDKVHLVPFGEYVPYPKVFFFVRAIAQVGGDMLPGKPGTVLPAGQVMLGPLICYESVFPYLARAMRRAGANLLINQTNDAWFGRTSAPYQHMSHLALRSIETRLACARAANTGISGFVLPDGRIVDTAGIFTAGVRTRSLPLMRLETFFTRHGDLLGPGGLVISCLAALWAGLWRWRNKEG